MIRLGNEVADRDRTSEKRKVGSSTLPLTTIASPAGSLHHLCLACSRGVFAFILAGMPECAAECRRVRGELVGAAPEVDLWDFCGAAGGFRRLTQ
jgi:hypothetical protein